MAVSPNGVIDYWLDDLKKYWLEKDTSSVLTLFADDVEYWETPFSRMNNKEELRKEWEVIKKQKIKELSFDVVSGMDNMFTIKWNLEYESEQKLSHWKGLYLVRLNYERKCVYFYQIGERCP